MSHTVLPTRPAGAARHQRRAGWITALAALGAAVAAAVLLVLPAPAAEVERGSAVQSRFEPRCDRPACQVWRDFRAARPYPVQTLAARVQGAELVLVISEPALPPDELAPLVRTLFGTDLLQLTGYRWRIGLDGWLEDAVLRLRWDATDADPLRQPLLRDRLAVLASRLWGSAAGLMLESIDQPLAARARSAAPNLELRPTELAQWLQDPQLRWRRLGSEAAGQPLAALQAAGESAQGTWVSSDGRLVALLVPPAALKLAADPAAFARRWRTPFRQFAVAGDVIVGASWSSGSNKAGSLAVLARARRVGTDVLPPLRHETFAVLARVDARQLAQSYERNTPFAGKLQDGPYAQADWAPIYLSGPLIDTEFGALLNITDQMLKSWSSAGEIEYLYFDYPLRPAAGRFAFGAEPLSAIVRRETGSLSVLFNWNTAGASSVVASGDTDVLVPGRTGALPVTYGAEIAKGQGVVTGQRTGLLRHENTAFSWFADQRDPNLARVVNYTVLYQALDAFRLGRGLSQPQAAAEASPRRAATDVLVDEVAGVVEELSARNVRQRLADEMAQRALERAQQRGTLTPAQQQQALQQARADARRRVNEWLGETPERVQRLRGEVPALRSAKALARALVDRNEGNVLWEAFEQRQRAYRADVDRFNTEVRARRLTRDVGEPWRARLDAEEAALDREFRQLQQTQSELDRTREGVAEVAPLLRPLEGPMARYVKAAQAPTAGWIRTPSIVVSWNARNERSVGGHNLDAHALRIEVDPKLTAAEVVRGAGGRVLRVPPAQAKAAHDNAAQLARRIEHERMDSEAARRLLADATPVPARPLQAALEIEGPPLDNAALARRAPVDDATLRGDMLASFRQHGRPQLMVTRDDQGYFILALREGNQDRCCVRLLDLASLRDAMLDARGKGSGDVVLVGLPERQVQALRRNLAGPDDQVLVEALGAGGGGREPPGGSVHVLRGEPPERGPGGGAGGKQPGGGAGGNPPGGGPGGEPGSPDGPPLPREPVVALLTDGEHYIGAWKTGHEPRRLTALPEPLQGEAAQRELAALHGEAGLHVRRALDSGALRGEPVVFKLTWAKASGTRDQHVLAAGVDPANAGAGQAAVMEAVQGARNETTLVRFHARVKDLVERHRDREHVWSLIGWLEDKRPRFLLSRADSQGSTEP